MEELDRVVKHIKYMFYKDIITALKDKSLTVKEAKQYVGPFLKLNPFSTIEETKTKVDTYVAQFPRYKALKEYMDAYDEELKTHNIIAKMEKHLEDKNVDQALQVAEKS